MSYDVLDPAAARLWPHLPNWSAGFNVRRSFATDIAISHDNTEQRRAMRFKPRFAIDYSTILKDAELRAANHWLRAWQNKPAVVPDFSRWARLTDPSSAASSVLEVDPLPVWIAAGQRLVLCGATMEEVQVASVAGTTITLVDPLGLSWPADAVLRPTFFGLMEGRISTRRMTPSVAEFNVSLNCYPGGEPPRAAGSAWETFNSREIFTLTPNSSSPPSIAALWPVQEVDVDRGRTAQFRPIDRAERMIEQEFRGLDLATMLELEQFFDRMKGRRGAFYLPSNEKDFALAASATSGTSIFLSTGLDIATDFGAIDYASVETAIAVCMLDGSHHYRRVTDIDSTGGNSRITVDSAWPLTLTTSNVARISWMPVCRFGSDDMTTSWQTPLKASSRLTFQSVRR